MRLCQAIDALRLSGGRPIPIRTNSKMIRGKESNRDGHFMRGMLYGVNGSKLICKPYSHGGRLEYNDPEHVNFWKSRIISSGVLTMNQLQKVLVTNDRNKSYVVVAMDSSGILKFFPGTGFDSFVHDINSAKVYTGSDSLRSARSCIGRLRNTSKWKEFFLNHDVKVISFDDASEAVGRRPVSAAIDNESKELGDSGITSSLEVELDAGGIIESGQEINFISSAKKDSIDILSDDKILDSLRSLQTAMSGVQTAIEMLRDEINNLVKTRESFVQKVAETVNQAQVVMQEADSLLGK